MSREPAILVVDDEEAICEGCRRIFSRQGFDVQKCNDANQGLNLAVRGDYAAILLDVKMPEMDGLHFLEALRKQKPSIPVILMTGYPSIPNATSAIRLGASDYVTKPFTPEEISQAVHRLLHAGHDPAAAAPEPPPPGTPLRFYREAWCQLAGGSAARVGALLVRPGTAKIESVRLPGIGEVVYQGLPLAAVTVAGQPPRTVPSPLSGVVVAVNESLAADPRQLVSDPCGAGWIACTCPTHWDDEAKNCAPHRVLLLSRNPAAAQEQAARLQWLGCEVRTLSDPADLAAAQTGFDAHLLLFDAPTFRTDGPATVGALNTENPGLKIVVLASADSILEPAYRIRRIFYYAVEPFADGEIAEILDAAFQPPPSPPAAAHRELAQPLGGLFVTNRNRTRVRLIAAPGLLRREEGLGMLLRQKLMQARFPLESSPSETPITPMNLLSTAAPLRSGDRAAGAGPRPAARKPDPRYQGRIRGDGRRGRRQGDDPAGAAQRGGPFVEFRAAGDRGPRRPFGPRDGHVLRKGNPLGEGSERRSFVILSAAKNPASLAIQPRSFAALRMTGCRPLPTAKLLRGIGLPGREERQDRPSGASPTQSPWAATWRGFASLGPPALEKEHSVLTATCHDATRTAALDHLGVAECYQCGKCSAGCPMAEQMDWLPNRLVRLVQMGRVERALKAEALWKCVSCMTCSTRCPKGVDCAGVIDALRQLAVERDTVPPPRRRTVLFQQMFLENIRRNGRICEVQLMGRFETKTFLRDGNLPRLLADALLVPRLMKARKASTARPTGPRSRRGAADLREMRTPGERFPAAGREVVSVAERCFVILSAAKNPASIALRARSFAALQDGGRATASDG